MTLQQLKEGMRKSIKNDFLTGFNSYLDKKLGDRWDKERKELLAWADRKLDIVITKAYEEGCKKKWNFIETSILKILDKIDVEEKSDEWTEVGGQDRINFCKGYDQKTKEIKDIITKLKT